MRHAPLPSLLALAFAAGATAQTITWGPVLPSTSPNDVSVQGALVVARNAHQPGVAAISPTVNGVTFTGAWALTGWAGYITGGLNNSTTGDAGFNNLLGTSLAMQTAPAANPSVWGGIRLDTLAQLVAGRTYAVQVWFTDQRTGTATNVLYDRQMTLSSAFGTATLSGGAVTNLGSMLQGPLSGPLDADPDNAPAAASPDTQFGSHCTGTFTHVSTSETWLLVQGTHPLANNVLAPHITALQIRDLSVAYHQNFGAGCHAYSLDRTNFLSAFAGTPAAKAALDGNALQFTPTSSGYVAVWLPGIASALYVPPSATATIVANADDTTTTFPTSVPVPVPGGTAAQWTVSSNGVLTAAATGNQGTIFTATLAATATAPGLAWYNWRDYNPAVTGSGKVKTEEVNGVLYVTFDGVYEYATTNPATFQWQVNLASGDVTMVWVSMATSSNTTTMVVGSTLAGAGPVPTSVDFTTATPFVMGPAITLAPLTLSASPAPVINPSTVVTYTVGNVPEFAPNTGVYISGLFLSLNVLPAGLDLTGILANLPGCRAYLGTLDLSFATVSLSPTVAYPFTFMAPAFPPGLPIGAQAAGLFDSAVPLINGENGGFVFSNGVLSVAQIQ
ncbi:MAG: hypothetical protein FJ301_06525 [Planctomycetes bacterium]|nr:hypothetical protein [Planctomycetota bacterium]